MLQGGVQQSQTPMPNLSGYTLAGNPQFSNEWNNAANANQQAGFWVQAALDRNIANGSFNGGEGFPAMAPIAGTMSLGGEVSRPPLQSIVAPPPPLFINWNNNEVPVQQSVPAINIANNVQAAKYAAPFTPPNLPGLVDGSTPFNPNLPGFSAPVMQGGQGTPYQMPMVHEPGRPTMAAPGYPGGGGTPLAGWVDRGGGGGGDAFSPGGGGPLRGINTANAVRGPAAKLVPPPPPTAPSVPTMTQVPPAVMKSLPPNIQAMLQQGAIPSEPRSPFLPNPDMQQASMQKGGPGAPAGGQAQQPKMAPTGDQQQPEPPKALKDRVKEQFGGLTPDRDPYAKTGDALTQQFENDVKSQIQEIDQRLGPQIAQARVARQRAVNIGNGFLMQMQQLPTDQQLGYRAMTAARQAADQQERDYQGFRAGGWVSQLISGRVPDRMMPRAAREQALTAAYFDRLVSLRDDNAGRIQKGLDWATAQLKEADSNLNHLMERRNQEVNTVTTLAKSLAMNQTNYARGMSTNDRGNMQNYIHAGDSLMRNENQVANRELRKQIAEEKMARADVELQIKMQNARTAADRSVAYKAYVDTMTKNIPMRTDADRAKAIGSVYQGIALSTSLSPDQKKELVEAANQLLGLVEEDDQEASAGGTQ